MSEEKESEFRQDAKRMVDSMFEGGLFSKQLTRSQMNKLENWLNVSMTMRYNSAKRLEELLNDINKKEE